jgi:hypothetical protein
MIVVVVWCLNLNRNSNEITIKTPAAYNDMPSQHENGINSTEHKSSALQITSISLWGKASSFVSYLAIFKQVFRITSMFLLLV